MMGIDVVSLKVILLLVMLLLTIFFGLAPLKVLKILRKRANLMANDTYNIHDHRWPSLILCLLSCFTGGVFLASCFLHLLPEVRDHLSTVCRNFHWHFDYPVAELISCLGFFLVFFVEELVIILIGGDHGHGHSHSFNDDPDDGSLPPLPILSISPNESTDDNKFITAPSSVKTSAKDNTSLVNSAENGLNPVGNIKETDSDALLLKNNAGTRRASVSCTNNPCLLNGENEAQFVNCSLAAAAEPECCEGPCDPKNEDMPIRMVARPHAHHHGVRSVTLLVALSFHSVIEGLAFGVTSSPEAVVSLFLSIMFHKCIVAFSVGVQIARTHAHSIKLVIVSILILAVMSPLGTAIGIGLHESNMRNDIRELCIMIFEGLSVGTFLYVTFFEVFLHERDNEHPNMLKLFVTVVGFTVIAAIRSLDHTHSLSTVSANGTDHVHEGHHHDHEH